MAYRFTPASNPYIDFSPGSFTGWLFRSATGNEAAFTIAALLKRNATGAWNGIVTVNDGAGTPAAVAHFLEFDSGNRLAGDDNNVLTYVSTKTFTNTTDWIIVALSFDGTDNVANNAQYRWKEGAGAWGSENETFNIQDTIFASIASGDRFRVGNNHNTSDDGNFDLVCLGFKEGYTNQAGIEALSMDAGGYATWQTLFDTANSALLRFDNISTLTDQGDAGWAETGRSAGGLSLVSDPTDFFTGGGPVWPPVDNPAAPPLRLTRSTLRLG